MTDVRPRVASILDEFDADDSSAAWLLCDRHPRDTPAFTIVDGSSTSVLTYGALADASTRLASGFRNLGLGPGDRIATLVRKGPELVATMLAAWRIGAVYVPLFTAFGAGAISYRLSRADVKVVVTDAIQRPKLDAARAQTPTAGGWRVVSIDPTTHDGDVAYADLLNTSDPSPVAPYTQGGSGAIVHTFTSGTTGDPKGVIHPLAYAAGWVSYQEFGLGVRPEDNFWCAADPGWAYGLYAAIIAPLATAAGNILQVGSFSADHTWRVLAECGVTNYSAAPTVYRALRTSSPGDDARLLRLERLSSAGEPLTPEVNEWAQQTFGLAVHDHYGQTEVGMIFANPHHPDVARAVIPGSMGHTLPGWITEVVDKGGVPAQNGESGELAIDTSSPFMTFRAYQDPRAGRSRFTKDGRYFLLGDLGRRDAEGYIHFSSRDDDVILMAGYRIGPFEVESAISRHPAVAECAVVAAPDATRGEVVEAFVVTRAGFEPTVALAEELQAAVKNGYSAHAYPRKVHFVETLPKTPSGKIQRYVLRERRRAELETATA